jgi:hypothetical protein
LTKGNDISSKKQEKAALNDGFADFLAVLEAHPQLLAFFFGLCFVGILLILAIGFPQPTAFQYMVFRIILALAAAGIAGVIPGLIQLKMQSNAILLINAGGALAVFVLIYLFAPADLNSTPDKGGDNQPNFSNRMIIDEFTEILSKEEQQRKEKGGRVEKNYKTDGKRKQTAKTQ